MQDKENNFSKQVYDLVKRIPRGQVATYGQIAALIGNPRAARVVGWALHALDRLPPAEAKQYPWWRVINSRGFISTTCEEHTFEMQRELLKSEGVKVDWNDKAQMYRVELDGYLWKV
jgi:methylated-DNA-protein-cysteine methyltransferase related protein